MRLKQIFNQANIYIFLWCIYFLQGTLYTSASFVSQGILAILLLMSLYNVYYLNRNYKVPKYFKALNTLLVMFTVYGILLIISGKRIATMGDNHIANYEYLKAIYISLLPIYSAYLYTIKGQLTQNTISKWIFIWLLIATAQYFRNQSEALEQLVYGREEITNNMGYTFVALMPVLIILNKRPIIQYSVLLYCLVFIFMGMKRGAIVIGVVVFLYFIYRSYKISSKKMKKYIILFIVGTIIAIADVIINMLETSDYFYQRIEQTLEGDSSNRDIIYSKFLNHFLSESNLLELLLGNGANATVVIGGNYAHNDWLEIMINNGLIGVFIYLVYWINFTKLWIKSKINPIAYSAIGMILLITFLQTLISMSYGSLEIYMTISLGYFMAISYDKKVLIER